MKDNPKDNEVGYGKPPRKTQFQPGTSGNPKGRPRTGKSVAVEIRDELKRRVTIRENGKERSVTKATALAKQVVARAMAGDARAFQQLTRLIPGEFTPAPDPKINAQEPVGAEDAAIIERFLARWSNQLPKTETAPDTDSEHSGDEE